MVPWRERGSWLEGVGVPASGVLWSVRGQESREPGAPHEPGLESSQKNTLQSSKKKEHKD